MGKQALCVRRLELPAVVAEALQPGAPPTLIRSRIALNSVLSLKPEMQDRDTCETDPDFLQLIPYAAVQFGLQFLCYARGGGGEEGRLHAKRSVGFGGHVDRMPDERETLRRLMMLECSRELKEELSLDVTASHLAILGLVASGQAEVDRVHLGVCCLCAPSRDVKAEKLLSEQNVITGLELLYPREISEKYSEHLEPWSVPLAKLLMTWESALA